MNIKSIFLGSALLLASTFCIFGQEANEFSTTKRADLGAGKEVDWNGKRAEGFSKSFSTSNSDNFNKSFGGKTSDMGAKSFLNMENTMFQTNSPFGTKRFEMSKFAGGKTYDGKQESPYSKKMYVDGEKMSPLSKKIYLGEMPTLQNMVKRKNGEVREGTVLSLEETKDILNRN